ncbi:MAG: hypothetical protein KGJ37_07030, partial [Verrucomicrobiota bacterium]|nr:hypothetical protein [Verrucomicrobiota bacterium]
NDPAQPVLVAGEPETRAREERSRSGIPVPPALAEKIRAICARAGAGFVLEDKAGADGSGRAR